MTSGKDNLISIATISTSSKTQSTITSPTEIASTSNVEAKTTENIAIISEVKSDHVVVDKPIATTFKNSTSTIDDVVSSIMHKIQNNEPFEGELAMANLNQARPSKKIYKSTLKANTKASKAQITSNTTTTTSNNISLNNIMNPATALLAPICQQIIPDQVTILSNFNQIIRDTMSPIQVNIF